MSLHIQDTEAERLAETLAKLTGQSVPDAVIKALRAQIAREKEARQAEVVTMVSEAMAIGHHCANLPVLDQRNDDELLGYGADGLPS